jgi:hypothetical protein
MQLHRGALGIRRRTRSINTPETLPFRMAHREFSIRQKASSVSPTTLRSIHLQTTLLHTKLRRCVNKAPRTQRVPITMTGLASRPTPLAQVPRNVPGIPRPARQKGGSPHAPQLPLAPPSLVFAVTIVTVLLEPVLVRWIRRSGPERLPRETRSRPPQP